MLISASSWREEALESDLVRAIFSSSSREWSERRDPKTEARFDFCKVLGRALGLGCSESTGLGRWLSLARFSSGLVGICTGGMGSGFWRKRLRLFLRRLSAILARGCSNHQGGQSPSTNEDCTTPMVPSLSGLRGASGAPKHTCPQISAVADARPPFHASASFRQPEAAGVGDTAGGRCKHGMHLGQSTEMVLELGRNGFRSCASWLELGAAPRGIYSDCQAKSGGLEDAVGAQEDGQVAQRVGPRGGS